MNDIPALAEFCHDLATVLTNPDITGSLRAQQFDALKKAHSRAVEFTKRGFPLLLTEPIYKKRAAMILTAKSATQINKILAPPHPRYDGNKLVNDSPYAIDEEELLIWSEVSMMAPLSPEGFNRFKELFEKIYNIAVADL